MKVGDVVQLRSGGPRMTVECDRPDIREGVDYVQTVWIAENGEAWNRNYPVAALVDVAASSLVRPFGGNTFEVALASMRAGMGMRRRDGPKIELVPVGHADLLVATVPYAGPGNNGGWSMTSVEWSPTPADIIADDWMPAP